MPQKCHSLTRGSGSVNCVAGKNVLKEISMQSPQVNSEATAKSYKFILLYLLSIFQEQLCIQSKQII